MCILGVKPRGKSHFFSKQEDAPKSPSTNSREKIPVKKCLFHNSSKKRKKKKLKNPFKKFHNTGRFSHQKKISSPKKSKRRREPCASETEEGGRIWATFARSGERNQQREREIERESACVTHAHYVTALREVREICTRERENCVER